MVLNAFVVVQVNAIEKDAPKSGYSIPSESQFINKLNQLRTKYPNGGTYSGIYYEDGREKAKSCYGYACQMMFEVFGARFYADGFYSKKDYTMGTIYAGDFVRLDAGDGPDTHSIFVTKVTSDHIYFTDANFDYKNGIRWDCYYTKSDFTNRFTYKVHIPGNTLTGNGTHTHSYDTYAYYWKSHPHYECYKCSCGKIKEDTNKRVVLDTCDQCLADYKAVLKTDKSKYGIGESVTIGWDAIPGATHYNLWLYKKNSDGTSQLVSRDDLLTDTSITYSNLSEGNYYTYFQTYNKNFWTQDKSDWFHSRAEEIEFEVTNKILPDKPILNVRAETSAEYTQFYWDPTNYTDSYTLHIYDEKAGEELPLVENIKELNYQVSLPSGDYTAFLASINDNLKGTDLWYTISDSVSFTVTKGEFKPLNSIIYADKKYEIYDIAMPWTEAKAKCEELGGHLVTITSQGEMDIVRILLKDGARAAYWMGISDEASEGQWENITDEEFSFTNWDDEEPNNFNGVENYGAIINKGEYCWNDVMNMYSNCSIGFICEYEDQNSDTVTDSDTKATDTDISTDTNDTDEPKGIVGDVDGDGEITMLDVVMLQKAIANLIEFTLNQAVLADVNADTKTTMEDVVLIQKYIAKLITSFDAAKSN
ncbi:MAG: lectin-like protein [Clostridia bacterium]|nr:lectin-like protein [Clostridia bacterium]